MTAVTPGTPNGGGGADLAIFPDIRTHSSCRLLSSAVGRHPPHPISYAVEPSTHVDEVLRLDRLALIAAQRIRPFHRDAGRDRAAIVGDQRVFHAALDMPAAKGRLGRPSQ
jgi:hypothetical protein